MSNISQQNVNEYFSQQDVKTVPKNSYLTCQLWALVTFRWHLIHCSHRYFSRAIQVTPFYRPDIRTINNSKMDKYLPKKTAFEHLH